MTSAATIGARTLLPVVPAAVIPQHSDLNAFLPRLARRVRSAGIFLTMKDAA